MTRLCFVSNSWVKGINGQYYFYPWFVNLHRHFIALFSSTLVLAAQAEPDVSSGFDPDQLVAALEHGNTYVRTLSMRGGRLRRLLSQSRVLWSAFGETDLACIDMPNETGVLAVALCTLKRKPFFVRVLGDWASCILLGGPPCFRRSAKAVMADLITWVVVRLSPLVFVQGQDLYDKHHGGNPRAVVMGIAHSPLTEDVFHERRSEAFHDPIRILTVSTLSDLKGLDVLARAIRTLADGGVSAEWRCVGTGPNREVLETLCRDLSIYERVRFLGHVPFGPSLLELYRQADIFVLPSLTEGVPNALLEAMANSLPVVASAVGGIPAVVENRVNGLLVTPGSSDELAQAITALVRERELAIRLRTEGFRNAKQYEAQVIAEKSLREIRRVFFEILVDVKQSVPAPGVLSSGSGQDKTI